MINNTFNREVLAEVIYKINQKSPFLLKGTLWSSPTYGFSHDKSRSIKAMDAIMDSGIIKEDRADVICILCDWESVPEGIFFTHKSIYLDSPKNETKKFSIKYEDIVSIKYYAATSKLKISTNEGNYYITTPIWSKRSINIFLQYVTGSANFDEEDKKRVKDIKIESADNADFGALASGLVYGNISNASTAYGMDKFGTQKGHGFAAERANHLYDKIANADFFGQNKVKLVGDEIDPQTGRIVKNGADRIVNGVQIQTKYCSTGSKCISECFDDGKFRYFSQDGSPMQIEVPSDKYDAAVKAMEDRINKGEVAGVTDPKEAKNIVRKGHYTYTQAKNIAKAGNIDSIKFDATNGAIVAAYSFGISTAISFAVSIWNGEDVDIALKNATHTGLKIGGTTFITAVLSSQLAKAGLNSALVSSSEAIVNIMGPKASALIANAFRSGTNIYGAAAMKSAAKLLRGNVITGIVSVAVLSSVDVVNIFRGRISGKQLFKNITNTASTVAGGTAGWMAGAAIGSIIPVVGTVVGGLVGAFAGGSLAGKASDKVLDSFIEDDADEMVKIIEEVFTQLAEDYLLNQTEAENIIDNLKEVLNGKTLKDMFESSDREEFANDLLIDFIEDEIKMRKHIELPDDTTMQEALKNVLEEVADSIESEQD